MSCSTDFALTQYEELRLQFLVGLKQLNIILKEMEIFVLSENLVGEMGTLVFQTHQNQNLIFGITRYLIPKIRK